MLLLICYVIFPIIVWFGIRNNELSMLENWLNKKETDAIRGVAILFIVLHHVTMNITDIVPMVFPIAQLGFVGVSTFFLLSGYALVITYGNKKVDVNFLGKRFVRMILPYVLIYCFYLILSLLKREQINGAEIGSHFLHLSLPGEILWYFKVQLLLYIIFWGCFGVFFRNRSKKAKILGVNVCVVLYIIIAFKAGLEPYWYITVVYFSLGLWLGYYKEIIYNILLRYNVLFTVASLIGFIGLLAYTFFYGFGNYYYVIHICLTLLFNVSVLVITAKWKFNSAILAYIGKISLELYLIHGVIQNSGILGKWSFEKGINILLFLIISILGAEVVHLISGTISRQWMLWGKKI